MKKKILGILVCMLLLSVMPFVASAEKIDNECGEVDVKRVNVVGNSPPTTPIVTGPEKGKVFQWITVTALSTDPDGDDIFYRYKHFESGTPSDWNGPWPSGYEFPHISKYFVPASYTKGFQAKDIHGAESDWAYHTVTITKVKSNSDYKLEQLIQRFPFIAQLLQLPVFEKLLNLR